MVTKSLNNNLLIDKDRVLTRLGYRDRMPPEMLVKRVEEQMENALKLITPVYAYQYLAINDVLKPDFRLEGGLSFSSKTVSYALDGCQKAAVYLATLGNGIDKEIARLFAERQTMAGTILDTIGSIAINQMLVELRVDVRQTAENTGLQVTRHYGPGHCDWELEQQRILFPVLEHAELGVRLNEACMMIPRKSISGVIGIGNIDNNKKAPCILFCQKSATCEYRNL